VAILDTLIKKEEADSPAFSSISAPLSIQGSWLKWCVLLLPLVLLFLLYHESLAYLVDMWMNNENYSHGMFVPVISAYLIWENRHVLSQTPIQGTWWGFPLLVLGLAVFFLGELSTLYIILHLSFWITLVAMSVSFLGTSGLKVIGFPMFYLLTMFPLPNYLTQVLSGKLQVISSQLGVGCLQLVGVTAFREGNVIDLGPIQLQVVEACSGLRYLFPLMSLALLCAYLFKDRPWKRMTLFLSSIPISILLNGLRIGMIGVLVDYFGRGLAEGFYHFFEGWVIFLASLVILIVEMFALSKIGKTGSSMAFLTQFQVHSASPTEGPRHAVEQNTIRASRLSLSYVLSIVLLAPVLVAAMQIRVSEEVIPPRKPFLDFPMKLEDWKGKTYPLEPGYIEALRFDDYILADFEQASTNASPVNFYVAYYQSQKKGQSVHSPRTCIPGGGWDITSLTEKTIPYSGPKGTQNTFSVNRAVIQKGEHTQLVYYWFQQRGRLLTNEYLVKWFIFWDAMTKNRTDGALVRLTTLVLSGQTETEAEQSLLDFTQRFQPYLDGYVPN